jgi:regulator of protease activity HflC (stomatin/prohibitin superfamily)
MVQMEKRQMNEWIITNLQVLIMGFALLTGVGIALSGLHRYDHEDGERAVGYNPSRGKFGLKVGVVALLTALTVAWVPAGHRGVIFDQGQGVLQEEKGEGITLVIPLWQRVHNLNVRTQVYEYESFVQTEDLQEVTLPIAINFVIAPDSAAELFQEVGFDYVETIIAPAAFQASTEAAGKIVAASIAQSRAELAADIGSIIGPQLADHGILVEYVSVKDAVFDGEFLAAVKAKVIATEKAEESSRLVIVAENEALQEIARAEGEADAIAIRAAAKQEEQSLLGLSPVEYVWFTTWNGQLPVTLIGDTGEFIVTLP